MDNQKRIRLKPINIVVLVVFVIVLAGMIFGNIMCYMHAGEITSHLVGNGVIYDHSDDTQQTLAEGDKLVRNIADEGIVLLKNQNGALPLAVRSDAKYKINLFGVGSTPDGFTYSGEGSGASTIVKEDILNSDGSVKFKSNRLTLQQGLEESGFEVNTELLSAFTGSESKWNSNDPFDSGNPDANFWKNDNAVLRNAKEFSDTAIVTLSRHTGENARVPELTTSKWENTRTGSGDDPSRLKLDDKEEAMLDYVSANFGTVIVIINSTNIIEMGFLNDDGIDAALNVGTLGQSGTAAIGRILSGAVNPSGKLTDTAVYDSKQDPTYVNVVRSQGGRNAGGNQITYVEDIYVGYKWYETAYADGVKIVDPARGLNLDFSDEAGYDNIVQFPFGYGLSYTSFSWELGEVKWKIGENEVTMPANGVLTDEETTISITVKVTNEGERAGKDVVQLYYSAPYTKGEIEKSAVNLVAFEKTPLIEPHATKEVTLTFDVYDMASYDCYDANGNDFIGWELDPGDYTLRLCRTAHDPSEIPALTVNVPATGDKGFTYQYDPETNGYVYNRFTGSDAEAGMPIDGSTLTAQDGSKIKYMSRSDFNATFPYQNTPKRNATAALRQAWDYYYKGYDDAAAAGVLEAPEIGRTEGEMLYLYTAADGSKASEDSLNGLDGSAAVQPNEELIMELGSNYDSKKWDTLLSQITAEEIDSITGSAGFGTKAAESIGKPRLLDYDGPSGFNSKITTSGDSMLWTAFPGECVLGQTWNKDLAYEMGFALGSEAKKTGGMTGIYAPTVNLHRSPYFTRNYEAYSEDGVLSGYMAADMIRGAKDNGLSCYLKHFALSELGYNPNDVNTWLTEQNLRENYLKAFEIAVKDGQPNAVMSSFNCIGAVRCCNSYALLTQVLRKEWNFEGSVVTDYNMGTTREHVRSGNDLHLLPNENVFTSWLNENNAADVYAGYNAVKNAVYSYCNTYYAMKTYDPDAEMVLSRTEEVFAWWIPVLIALDVLVVGGMAFCVFWIFRPRADGQQTAEPVQDHAAE